MSLTARARLLAALTAACALLAGLVGAAGVGVMTAEPEHTVTLRFEDVEQMPEGITPETVTAAAGEGVPTWRPLEMVVTGSHLTLAETAGSAELPADVVLSTQDEDADFDSQHITSEFRRTERVKAGAAVRPGLFDADMPADPSTRWDVATTYGGNRDLGHGAHAVTAAARTAGELTYDGAPREPLLYAGAATALLALGLLPALLWSRTRRRVEALRARLRAARTDLARVVLDLEATEAAVLTTPDTPPGTTPGPDLRAQLGRLVRGTFDLARAERALACEVRRPSRGTPAALEGHERAVAGARSRAQALHEAATLRSRHAGARTAADRLVAPLVLAAQPVIARARSVAEAGGAVVPADRPAVAAEAARLQDAVDALLTVATEAGDGRLEGFAPRVLDAEARLGGAARSLVGALRAGAGTAVDALDQAALAVPPLRPDPEDVARRDAAGLPAVGPATPLQDLAVAHAVLLVAAAPAGRLTDAVRAVTEAAQDEEIGGSVHPPSPDSWRAAVARAADVGARQRARDDAHRPTPWPARLAVAAGCVLLAALATKPLADGATAEPGWYLTGEADVASLRIDGVPRGSLTAEDMTADGVRDHLAERLPDGLEVVVAVRPDSGYLVYDRSAPSTASRAALDRPRTMDGLARLKGEFPELTDGATGDLRPEAVIVPVFVRAGGTVAVDVPLTGVVSYGTENSLGSGGHGRSSIVVDREARLAEISAAWQVEDVARGVQQEGAFAPDLSRDGLWALLTVSGTVVLAMLGVALRALAGALARRVGIGPARRDVDRARRKLETLMTGLDLQRLDAVAVLGTGPAAGAREAEQRLWESALVAAWREADELDRLPLRAHWDAGVRARASALAARVADLATHHDDVAARAAAAVSTRFR